MIILLSFLTFNCPNTRIINYTDTWNQFDKATLKRTKIRCIEIYPKSPCVKIFIKKEKLLYNVICGK